MSSPGTATPNVKDHKEESLQDRIVLQGYEPVCWCIGENKQLKKELTNQTGTARRREQLSLELGVLYAGSYYIILLSTVPWKQRGNSAPATNSRTPLVS